MSTTHIGTQRFYVWVYVAEKITHVNTIPPMQLLRSETRYPFNRDLNKISVPGNSHIMQRGKFFHMADRLNSTAQHFKQHVVGDNTVIV